MRSARPSIELSGCHLGLDPLHGARADAVAFGDLEHSVFALGERGFDLAFGIRFDLRPPKRLAFLTRSLKARVDARDNDAALKLREHAEHLKHGPAGRRTRIERLLMQEKIDASGVNFAQEGDKMLQGSSKSIDRPSSDHIDFAPGRGFQHLVECRPLVAALSATYASIRELGHNIPSVMRSRRHQFAALIFDALSIRTYAQIERDTLCLSHVSIPFSNRAARNCCVYHVAVRDRLAANFMCRHIANADKLASGIKGPQNVSHGAKPRMFANWLELLADFEPWLVLHTSYSIRCTRILSSYHAENSCLLHIGLRLVKAQALRGILRGVCTNDFCIARIASRAVASLRRALSQVVATHRCVGSALTALASHSATVTLRCVSPAGHDPRAPMVLERHARKDRGHAGGGEENSQRARQAGSIRFFARLFPETRPLTPVIQ